jgi:hypothetical protein
MFIIRAVAIGRGQDKKFDAQNTNLDGVRPYIKGLVDWLALAPNVKANPETDGSIGQYTLGAGSTGYEIEYKEREVHLIQDAFSGAENADVLFCMSTYVGAQAAIWRDANAPTTAIVVITSDPSQFDSEAQMCGVSALRPQLASIGLRKFKKAQPNLTKILLLHRQNYGPSDRARKGLGSKKPPIKLATVKDTEDPSVVVANLRAQVPANETHGLFVLPADRFFGWATEIQAAANASGKPGSAMKTYWTTSDWPTNSYGGYGFPQNVCGRYMAERVASIWENNLNIPDPAFVVIDPAEIKTKTLFKKQAKSGSAKKKR